jgi:predicted MFS family arabinose efflux permease
MFTDKVLKAGFILGVLLIVILILGFTVFKDNQIVYFGISLIVWFFISAGVMQYIRMNAFKEILERYDEEDEEDYYEE